VDNAHRKLHGALLDAELLAEVYLAMTAGQGDLAFAAEQAPATTVLPIPGLAAAPPARTRVLRAGVAEAQAHEARLRAIAKKAGGRVLWPADEDADAATGVAVALRG
jgi:DNA polymerase-3 subunit epsilon